MRSQARREANKHNAARSTGPLTAVGKKRASRNASKHGLTIGIRHDPGTSNKIETLAVAIAGKNATPRLLQAARDVAEAQLEARRLQDFKLALIELEATRIHVAMKARGSRDQQYEGTNRSMQHNAEAYVRALPVLAKLERYERRAQSRMRRAFRIYTIIDEDARQKNGQPERLVTNTPAPSPAHTAPSPVARKMNFLFVLPKWKSSFRGARIIPTIRLPRELFGMSGDRSHNGKAVRRKDSCDRHHRTWLCRAPTRACCLQRKDLSCRI